MLGTEESSRLYSSLRMAMSGLLWILRVTRALNWSLSTAKALPAGRRLASAHRTMAEFRSRSSALRRPLATRTASEPRELLQTSSPNRSVSWMSVWRKGRISHSSTVRPRRARVNAASLPARPPPTTRMSMPMLQWLDDGKAVRSPPYQEAPEFKTGQDAEDLRRSAGKAIAKQIDGGTSCLNAAYDRQILLRQRLRPAFLGGGLEPREFFENVVHRLHQFGTGLDQRVRSNVLWSIDRTRNRKDLTILFKSEVGGNPVSYTH